jgi:hypothetical protein
MITSDYFNLPIESPQALHTMLIIAKHYITKMINNIIFANYCVPIIDNSFIMLL